MLSLVSTIRNICNVHSVCQLTELEAWAVTGGCGTRWGVVALAVLGKNIWGVPGPSSFGRQQWLSEITIEPIKNLGPGKIWRGLCPPALA